MLHVVLYVALAGLFYLFVNPTSTAMAVDHTTDQRSEALKKITYGFYILTTRKDAGQLTTRSEDYVAAGTVCWVSQVSFNPPMVMVAVQKTGDLNETIQKSRVFALSFIGSSNQELIEHFSHKTDVHRDRLNGYSFEDGQTGSPLITACPLAIECNLTEVVHTHGDHVLLIGEVVNATIRDANAHLLSDQEVDYNYGG